MKPKEELKIFKNKKKAVQLCVNRFDNLTKDAFINLFDKIFNNKANGSNINLFFRQ